MAAGLRRPPSSDPGHSASQNRGTIFKIPGCGIDTGGLLQPLNQHVTLAKALVLSSPAGTPGREGEGERGVVPSVLRQIAGWRRLQGLLPKSSS